MKKPFIFIVFITFLTVSIFAQDAKKPPFADAAKGFHYFNTYFEWGFGDLMQPDQSKRVISEFIEVKSTYMYTFGSVPWLSIGFTAMYQTSPQWLGKDQPGPPSKTPRNSFVISGDFMIGQTLGLSFGSDGMITAVLMRNVALPDVSSLQSHSITFMSKSIFNMKGAAYSDVPTFDADGAPAGTERKKVGGWFDSADLRIIYNMRFNDYVGLGLWNVFAVMGGPLFNGGSFMDAFMYRFNPRLHFYAPGGWSFFAEPRFFVMPGMKEKFAVELKFGMDYTFTAMQQ